MAWVATGAAVVGGVAKFIGGKKAARAAARRKRKLQKKLDHLERMKNQFGDDIAIVEGDGSDKGPNWISLRKKKNWIKKKY